MKRSTQNKAPFAVVPLTYSVEEAALALGVGRSLISRLIKEGQLNAFRIGHRTLLRVEECEAFLARLSVPEIGLQEKNKA